MTEEHWTDRLSEYLDDELDATERAEVEAHLEACGECRATLSDLRSVVGHAAELSDLEPERDLWPGIRGRLVTRAPVRVVRSDDGVPVIPLADRRRVVVTIPQLVAAAIALVLFSAGGVWMALSGSVAPASPVATASVPGLEAPQNVTLTAAYEQAVSELQAEFELRRATLEPETIVVVERNLAIIDQAIAEARTALAGDPSSGFLNSHLAEAMRQKVDLLRAATKIERRET